MVATTAPSGYSGNPLVKKLGIKANSELCVLNAPDNYASLVAPLPEGVRTVTTFAPQRRPRPPVRHAAN